MPQLATPKSQFVSLHISNLPKLLGAICEHGGMRVAIQLGAMISLKKLALSRLRWSHSHYLSLICLTSLALLVAPDVAASETQEQPDSKSSFAGASSPPTPSKALQKRLTRPKFIFKPAIRVTPLGYMDLDVETENNVAPFFNIRPKFSLISLFPRAALPPIRLVVGYQLDWSFFRPRFLVSEIRQHSAFVSTQVPLSARTSLNLNIAYAHIDKVRESLPGPTDLLRMATFDPHVEYTFSKALSVKGGYWLGYFGLPNFGMLTQQLPVEAGGGVGGWGNLYLHTAALGLKYNFSPAMNLKFDYKWVLRGASSSILLKNHGHIFSAAIEAPMPWKGGSLSLSDTLWIHIHDKTILGGGPSDLDSLNFFKASLRQKLQKHIDLEASAVVTGRRSSLDVIRDLHRDTSFFVGVEVHL